MRYVKVLVLAVFLFLALIFFFQNQAALSQQMEMSLNLFFLPPMQSIPLPFYFIVIAAFFVGCVLSLFWLAWDKVLSSSKLMKTKWQVSRLQTDVDKLQKQLLDAHEKLSRMQDAPKEAQVELRKSDPRALPSSDAPADEQGNPKSEKA